MKKTLVTLLMAIGLLFAVNSQTQAQNAFLVQGGFSWSEGVAAVGYQINGVSSTLGYMPAKMPGDGSSVSGVVWNIKAGPRYNKSGLYLSYALNTVGYRSQMSYNGGSWQDNYVEAMNILSAGYKIASLEGFYLSGDLGYGWSASGSGASWGLVLGVAIN
jgi:hypothetical protein